jgi:hypothetical protein
MGHRYDMQGRDPQVQAIVRKRDAEDKRREEESKKLQEKVDCREVPNHGGDYQSVCFTKGNEKLLELRISNTAVKIIDEDVQTWLRKTGREFINEVKSFEIIMITSENIINKRLQTNWKNLKRIEVEAPK